MLSCKQIFEYRAGMLKGKRTLIAFTVGTILISGCLYFTKDKPENFTPLMAVWCGIMATFVGKNLLQSKEDKKDGKEKES